MAHLAHSLDPPLVNIYGNSANWESEDPRSIEKFMELFNSNVLGIPFAKFHLGAFCMTDPVGEEFLRLCGEIAKEIDRTLGSEKFMVEDVSELLRSTPNLVKFKIPIYLHSQSSNIVKLFPDSPENPKPKIPFLKKLKSSGDFPESRIKFCPTFLEELIEAAENITHLSIGRSYMSGNSGSGSKCTSLEVLSIIEKLGRVSSIQSLYFLEITEEHVEILRRMKSNGMKLKKIMVSWCVDDGHLIQVASLFMDTIEHFSLLGAEICNNSMQFLKMPNLRWLEIHISDNFDLRSLNLKNSFPSLEKLEVDQSGSQNEYDELFSESNPCPKMKSFSLCSPIVKITGFKRTLTLFPKLKELYLHVRTYESVLRNIWTEMTMLEVLVLIGSVHTTENLDSIFTGISAESLQEIETLVNELDEMTKELRRETILRLRNQHTLLPSIVNLSNLRRLELIVTVGIERTCLTDVTGYLGFYAFF